MARKQSTLPVQSLGPNALPPTRSSPSSEKISNEQYCNGGDLENYIISRVRAHEPTIAELKAQARRKSRGQLEATGFSPVEFPIDTVYSFTRDIVAGLNHLHQNGIIQYDQFGVYEGNNVSRDLKPGNCLISIGRGPIPKVLVGDFGEGYVEGSGKVGTGTVEVASLPTYADNSILLQNLSLVGSFCNVLIVGTRSSRVLSTKADMFSLGMVIHFMAFRGKLPYTATGETLESLNELRREVQAFPG